MPRLITEGFIDKIRLKTEGRNYRSSANDLIRGMDAPIEFVLSQGQDWDAFDRSRKDLLTVFAFIVASTGASYYLYLSNLAYASADSSSDGSMSGAVSSALGSSVSVSRVESNVPFVYGSGGKVYYSASLGQQLNERELVAALISIYNESISENDASPFSVIALRSIISPLIDYCSKKTDNNFKKFYVKVLNDFFRNVKAPKFLKIMFLGHLISDFSVPLVDKSGLRGDLKRASSKYSRIAPRSINGLLGSDGTREMKNLMAYFDRKVVPNLGTITLALKKQDRSMVEDGMRIIIALYKSIRADNFLPFAQMVPDIIFG